MIEVDPDTTVYETEADSDDEVLEVPKKKKKAPEGKTPEVCHLVILYPVLGHVIL